MSNWDDIYRKSHDVIHAPKRPCGKPRKREQRASAKISVRTTKDLMAKVKRVAAARGKSVADIVNELIEKMEDER